MRPGFPRLRLRARDNAMPGPAAKTLPDRFSLGRVGHVHQPQVPHGIASCAGAHLVEGVMATTRLARCDGQGREMPQAQGDSAMFNSAVNPLPDCSGTVNPDADFCGIPFAFCPIFTRSAGSLRPVAQFSLVQA